jgi:hypothetical protein
LVLVIKTQLELFLLVAISDDKILAGAALKRQSLRHAQCKILMGFIPRMIPNQCYTNFSAIAPSTLLGHANVIKRRMPTHEIEFHL